jgi:hypothetical protein
MWVVGVLAGVGLILLVLIDGFETILQPRRVTHRYRYARLYYRVTWKLWRLAAMQIRTPRRREAFLSLFGPLSLLGLFSTWVLGLIAGFGLVHWSSGSPLHIAEEQVTFSTYLYLSGTTFFTLGYGDVTPAAALGRALAVVESGLGFAFLAVIISYLPVLAQAFSRREAIISLMDARAGSPPSAAQFLLRLARSGDISAINPVLIEWERWAAELLESHLSFPVLSYYRSQHDNQSWLAALAAILDSCAVLLVEIKSSNSYQAQVTFAIARHAAVDLALVLKTPPVTPADDRLPTARLKELREKLRQAGVELKEGPDNSRLAELRSMYEPFINAIAGRFLFAVPPLMPEDYPADNWQRSAWMARTPGIGRLPAADDNDHFT